MRVIKNKIKLGGEYFEKEQKTFFYDHGSPFSSGRPGGLL